MNSFRSGAKGSESDAERELMRDKAYNYISQSMKEDINLKEENDVPDRKEKSKKNDIDILKCQYACAIDLYMHEDELNWKKLNNLFYITSALLFILSFISVGNFPYDVNPMLLGALSAFGAIISTSFGLTLRYGVAYLLARKEKVIQIEKIMESRGGISIVGYDRDPRIFGVSPTTKILRAIPFIFSSSWAVLFVFTMLRFANVLPT
jgi:hypothetical protein